MRLAVLLLSLAASLPAAAAAPTGPPPEQVFQSFGLFGTWASDCSAEPSPDNPYVRISQPAPGIILEDNDIGPNNVINRYSILSAEKLSDTRVSVNVIFRPGKQDEQRQTLIWAVHNGTLRTMFNRSNDGPARVKDGVAVRYGVKTPLLSKCKPTPTQTRTSPQS